MLHFVELSVSHNGHVVDWQPDIIIFDLLIQGPVAQLNGVQLDYDCLLKLSNSPVEEFIVVVAELSLHPTEVLFAESQQL